MEEQRGHHEEWKGHRTAPLDRQHKFSPKSFATPVPCDHCSQMIWGLLSNAVSCTGGYFPTIVPTIPQTIWVTQSVTIPAMWIVNPKYPNPAESSPTNKRYVHRDDQINRRFVKGNPHTFEVMSVLLTKPTYCNLCRSLLLSMIGKPGRICSGRSALISYSLCRSLTWLSARSV